MKNKSPIFVLFVTILIDLLGFGLIIPILPIFASELNAGPFVIGLIAGIYSLMNFLFAPFWGTLSDKIGRRPVMLISIFLTMLSYVFFSFTHSLTFLIISRIFSGMGSANISAAQAYIADITTPENRAKNMGIIGAGFGLGFIFGPPVGGYLKSISGAGSVDIVGYFAAGLCAFNLLLAYLYLPESLKVKNPDKAFSFKPIANILHELKKPVISELISINFLFVVAFSMMTLTATILWAEHYGFDTKQIGYVFMYIGLTAAIVQGGLVGKLSKVFGEKKLLLYGSLLMAFGLATLPFAPTDMFFFQFISLGLISLANGCLTPSINSLISQAANPGEQGQALGTNQSLGSLARVVGPVLGGFLFNLHYTLPYLLGGVLMIGAYSVSKLLKNQNTTDANLVTEIN